VPTLEELLRRAAKVARKPAAGRPRAVPLWPLPDDPGLLADPIQTMDFGANAKTIEEIIQFVHDHRNRVIWDVLALPVAGRLAGPLPWCAQLPAIFDPHHLLPGHAGSDWHTPHPLIDYYPSAAGLQHGVSFVGGRFAAHGVATPLLSAAPPSC
jgi:hypothetical protein